jgi:hypothetical protein
MMFVCSFNRCAQPQFSIVSRMENDLLIPYGMCAIFFAVLCIFCYVRWPYRLPFSSPNDTQVEKLTCVQDTFLYGFMDENVCLFRIWQRHTLDFSHVRCDTISLNEK